MPIKDKQLPIKGKELIERAVTRKPGEYLKVYLDRVSRETGINYWTLRRCYKGEGYSKETETVLTEAADNANNISSRMQELITLAEAASNHARVVDQDREVRDAFRDLVEQVRDLDRRLGQPAQVKAMKFAIGFAVAASAILILMPTET